MCTVSCADNGQADCNRVDTGSLCAMDGNGAFAYCYEACTFGASAGDAAKCHDRVDFACTPPQTIGGGFCTPMCRGDIDCPGRVCDPATGLCANAVSGNLPVGTACDPSASTSSCIGICAMLGTGMPTMDNSFCTSSCTLGRAGTCGQSPTATGPQPVGCVFKFASNSTDGDLGDCGQLCSCDSDCSNPGFVCHVNPLATAYGHPGACVPKLTFDGITTGMPCGESPHPGELTDAAAPADAAAPLDAGTDASFTPVSVTGGCSCRTASGAPAGRAPVPLTMLAVALGLRRRNARHTCTKR
jgi:MYXO-CTERM domain-containing protein